eukprot:gnl/TRDRNA2_/TRDRNA2_92672_c0_seq1.p1 gnl/TRDRNA2_/TRDRNA2_92672_c0~~gnl/TRDRNA2_/TRDRNA2_92672_c0_seq1.p1  ORF type:complete len:318 (+),score=48.08 gnl/TRDRNA2_/TRDRNA2_92672_c0_seq1:150-1103(+)
MSSSPSRHSRRSAVVLAAVAFVVQVHSSHFGPANRTGRLADTLVSRTRELRHPERGSALDGTTVAKHSHLASDRAGLVAAATATPGCRLSASLFKPRALGSALLCSARLSMPSARPVVLSAPRSAARSVPNGGEDAHGNMSAARNSAIARWEKAYKDLMHDRETGLFLADMACTGFDVMGRGAIFASYDGRGNFLLMTVDEPEWASGQDEEKPHEGVDVEYVKQDIWRNNTPANVPVSVVKAIESYDPESSFVVVVRANGMMGANIVKPRFSLRRFAKEQQAKRLKEARAKKMNMSEEEKAFKWNVRVVSHGGADAL